MNEQWFSPHGVGERESGALGDGCCCCCWRPSTLVIAAYVHVCVFACETEQQISSSNKKKTIRQKLKKYKIVFHCRVAVCE